LKAGLWFRRGRLFMVAPVRGDHRRFQAETPLIDLFKFAEPALLFKQVHRASRDLTDDEGPNRDQKISQCVFRRFGPGWNYTAPRWEDRW
jgi:hypothetical protein